MQGFIELKAGERFPFDIQDIKTEGATWRIVNDTFDVVVMLQRAKLEEIKAFRKGEFRYGVLVLDCVPILLIKFGDALSFELLFNIVLEKEAGRDIDTFLDSEANQLIMFLIDPYSRIIKALRVVEIDYETPAIIKEACREQQKHYRSAAEVNAKIDEIMTKYTHQDLLGLAHLRSRPNSPGGMIVE